MTNVLAPMAWTEFSLTPKPSRADIIAMINHAVNSGIQPSPRPALLADPWLIWPVIGQCHDYAVTKREELLLRGFAPSDCLLAECIVADGEHHLVLIVDGMVLDNLHSAILPVEKVRYTWVRRQTSANPDYWEAP